MSLQRDASRKVVALTIIGILVFQLSIPLVVMAATCAFGVLVQIKPNVKLNVRSTPVTGAVVSTVTSSDGAIEIKNVDLNSCWFQIADPAGYISNSTQYVQLITPTPVVATVTRVPLTNTPTPRPSPTKVTTNGDDLLITVNGVSFPCPDPCVFTVTRKLP